MCDPINHVAGRIELRKLSKYTLVSGMFPSGVTRTNHYIYNCFGASRIILRVHYWSLPLMINFSWNSLCSLMFLPSELASHDHFSK